MFVVIFISYRDINKCNLAFRVFATITQNDSDKESAYHLEKQRNPHEAMQIATAMGNCVI